MFNNALYKNFFGFLYLEVLKFILHSIALKCLNCVCYELFLCFVMECVAPFNVSFLFFKVPYKLYFSVLSKTPENKISWRMIYWAIPE
jgi:hypothetical protein